jgi:hypothetical protein
MTTTARQLGKVVTGSIQMSKPGSILLSAGRKFPCEGSMAHAFRAFDPLTFLAFQRGGRVDGVPTRSPSPSPLTRLDLSRA